MLDHVGIPVSDFMRSKGFYLKVLAPLGYGLVLEVRRGNRRRQPRGLRAKGKPQFWIGSGKPIKGQVHFAFVPRAGLRTPSQGCAGGRRQGQWRRVCGRTITRITTGPSSRSGRPQYRGGLPSANNA